MTGCHFDGNPNTRTCYVEIRGWRTPIELCEKCIKELTKNQEGDVDNAVDVCSRGRKSLLPSCCTASIKFKERNLEVKR